MIELLILAVGIAIGAWGSTLVNRWIFSQVLERLGIGEQRLRQLVEDMEQEQPTEIPRPELLVRLEQHSGVIYAYRKDNSQFLAQGTDVDQLIQHLDRTFADGARLIIREADGAELLQKNNG